MLEGLFGTLALLAAVTWPKGCVFNRRIARETAIALGVDFDKERFPLSALMEGMNVEREHFDVTHCDPILSARIALSHLRENPRYYKLLKKYVD